MCQITSHVFANCFLKPFPSLVCQITSHVFKNCFKIYFRSLSVKLPAMSSKIVLKTHLRPLLVNLPAIVKLPPYKQNIYFHQKIKSYDKCIIIINDTENIKTKKWGQLIWCVYYFNELTIIISMWYCISILPPTSDYQCNFIFQTFFQPLKWINAKSEFKRSHSFCLLMTIYMYIYTWSVDYENNRILCLMLFIRFSFL